MLYHTLKIGDKELHLRLTTRSTADLCKKLGKNPIMLVNLSEEEALPDTGEMMLVFHASLQAYHHEYTLDDAYNLFDEYIDNGGDYVKFVVEIIELFKVSGIIPKEVKKQKNA